jgi:hypothetical protein
MKRIILCALSLFAIAPENSLADEVNVLCGPRVRHIFLEEGHYRPDPIPYIPDNDNDPRKYAPAFFSFDQNNRKIVEFYCFYHEGVCGVFDNNWKLVDAVKDRGVKYVGHGIIPSNAKECVYRVNDTFKCHARSAVPDAKIPK